MDLTTTLDWLKEHTPFEWEYVKEHLAAWEFKALHNKNSATVLIKFTPTEADIRKSLEHVHKYFELLKFGKHHVA